MRPSHDRCLLYYAWHLGMMQHAAGIVRFCAPPPGAVEVELRWIPDHEAIMLDRVRDMGLPHCRYVESLITCSDAVQGDFAASLPGSRGSILLLVVVSPYAWPSAAVRPEQSRSYRHHASVSTTRPTILRQSTCIGRPLPLHASYLPIPRRPSLAGKYVLYTGSSRRVYRDVLTAIELMMYGTEVT